MPGLGRQQQKSWSGLVLICLSVCIIITLLNYALMLSAVSNNKNDGMLTLSSRGDSSSQSSPLLIKANSINSYWWPSTESGGLLGKMYAK